MSYSSESNFAYERLMAQIPSETLATFSPSQLQALQSACQPFKPKRHAIDFRVAIPFPGRGIYLVLLAGRERRSPQRLRAEKQYPSNRTVAGAALLILMLGSIAGLGVVQILRPTFSSLKQDNSYPTAIPWLTSREDCQNTGRVWHDHSCWDQEHNSNF